MLPELSDVEMLLLYTGAVLAVMFVLLSLVGRRLGSRSSAIRAVVPVTSQHRLHVVEVDGRRLLVGTGPQGAPSLVCELGDDPAWTREASMMPAEGEWSRTRVLPHGGRPHVGDGVPSVHAR